MNLPTEALDAAAMLAHDRLMWTTVTGHGRFWSQMTQTERDGWLEYVRDIIAAAKVEAFLREQIALDVESLIPATLPRTNTHGDKSRVQALRDAAGVVRGGRP